ncbi:hypothetical protein SARC_17234, partial [Sphaeroforma arctica JP610]
LEPLPVGRLAGKPLGITNCAPPADVKHMLAKDKPTLLLKLESTAATPRMPVYEGWEEA